VKPTKQPLTVQVTLASTPDALRSWNSALDLLADWLATDILERARAEAAAELGVAPAQIAPDPNGVAEAVRAHGESLVGPS
jgi:hypothetical protein